MPLTQVNELRLKNLRYMPVSLQRQMMEKCVQAISLNMDDIGTFRGMFTTIASIFIEYSI